MASSFIDQIDSSPTDLVNSPPREELLGRSPTRNSIPMVSAQRCNQARRAPHLETVRMGHVGDAHWFSQNQY
jgi:hypothetical protein